MGIIKYWEIKYFDSGSSAWITDTQIPRAGLNPFLKHKKSTMDFITLADGALDYTTNEIESNWQELTLTFPKPVVTEALRTQLSGYVNKNQGVRIVVPLTTGASLYTERVLEGYITNYNEEWELGRRTQRYTIKINMQEFDVDASG